jgi:CubicO group peptidase (beta-lactamase class C family)
MPRHTVKLLGLISIFSLLFSLSPAQAQTKAQPRPKLAATLAKTLDAIVEKAIAADELPGAVLLVSYKGQIIHRKAYGSRVLLPAREAMTLDTIFDMASLTKIVATTSSVMLLVEQGKVRLNDPVARYILDFAANGKEQVTVRHLLTHTGGLRPVPPVKDPWSGAEAVFKSIYEDTLIAPPGARFIYSDGGFIILAELVRRVSGLPVNEFALENIYRPLGMSFTRFLPPAEWKPRIAPTEEIDLPEGAKAGSGKGRVLRGEVHDPRARGMGGVAGHAGLFSIADDLAIFCRMILNTGLAPGGKRIFAAATVQKMTSLQTPPWSPTLRGLGWDIDSAYSAPRGEFFPLGTFGHTGFTGTAMWIDPQSQTFYILLANSVHPYGRPAISSLRSRVATAIAAQLAPAFKPAAASTAIERSVGSSHNAARNAQTKTGIDVLVEENFAALRGKRVGLITNHTGLDRSGRSTIDLLWKADGVKLVALFSPEHGIAGRADDKVASTTDTATGLPIFSLYG